MKLVGYEDVWELAEEMSVKFRSTHQDLYCISAYGKYEVIKALLEALIKLGHPIGTEIELECYDVSNYDKEYQLIIGEYGISVSKMWHKGNEYHPAGYLWAGGNICYVHVDCSSKMMPYIEEGTIIEFALYDFGDDEFDDAGCECCCEGKCECDCDYCNCDEDDAIHGVVVNNETDNDYSTFIYYNVRPYNKSDIRDVLKHFGF